MKNLKLILVLVLFQSCGTLQALQDDARRAKTPEECGLTQTATLSDRVGSLRTPQDVDKYLKKHLGKKKYKEWESHISDDKVIVHAFDQNGNSIGTAIGE